MSKSHSDSGDSPSPSQEKSGENGPEPIQCVVCDDPKDPRGYQQHLIQAHDFSEENASKTFETQKSRGDGGGSQSGVDAAAGGPTMSELAESMQSGVEGISAARMFREALRDDDSDALDQLVRAKEAGLIDSGPDEGLKDLAAAIQQQSAAIQNGGAAAQPAADGGAGSTVETAIAQGVTDPDSLQKLAELDPQKKKIDRKYQFRQNLVDRFTDAVSGTGVLEAGASALAQVLSDQETAEQPTAEAEQQQTVTAAQPAESDDDDRDADGGENLSPAARRFAEAEADENGGDDDDD